MEHKLTFTEQQLQILAAGLAELPFKVAQPMFIAMQQQIDVATKDAQNDSAAKPSPDQS